MGVAKHQPWSAGVWRLSRRQHGVVSRSQLLELGLSAGAIQHRAERGRLHTLWRGVYAVGRPQVSQHGWWMAAVLACGPEARPSHRSAAELWGLLAGSGPSIEIVIPAHFNRRRPGIEVHRRARLPPADCLTRASIPLTSPVETLIDIAATAKHLLDAAVNAADRLDLIDPETLRAQLESRPRRPGSGQLLRLLKAQ